MQEDIVWRAVMRRGMPRLLEQTRYRTWIAKAYADGDSVEVVVRRRQVRRSHKANARWWALVRALAEGFGWADPEELHDLLVHKFRPLPPDPLTGAPRRERTSKMSQAAFAALADEVQLWAEADHGFVFHPTTKKTEAA